MLLLALVLDVVDVLLEALLEEVLLDEVEAVSLAEDAERLSVR